MGFNMIYIYWIFVVSQSLRYLITLWQQVGLTEDQVQLAYAMRIQFVLVFPYLYQFEHICVYRYKYRSTGSVVGSLCHTHNVADPIYLPT